MAQSKLTVSKSASDVAEVMGLLPSKAVEWQVRHQLTEKIGQIIRKEKWTVSEVAKRAGTSRARVTEVLKGNTEGISIDVLLRILGSIGSSVKITFKKVS